MSDPRWRSGLADFQKQLESLVPGTEQLDLVTALTHKSFSNEHGGPDNERLEFLGDAVLGLCTSEMLMDQYPRCAEGELSRMRAAMVNARALYDWGRAIGISEAVRTGRGSNTERAQQNVTADAVEAVLGAVYAGLGLEAARRLVRAIVGPGLANPSALAARDPKGELQELLQGMGLEAPIYELTSREGPDHDPRVSVRASILGKEVGQGSARSRKLAERDAASEALRSVAEWLPEVRALAPNPQTSTTSAGRAKRPRIWEPEAPEGARRSRRE